MKVVQHDAATHETVEREATAQEVAVAAEALDEMEAEAAAFEAQRAARQSAITKLAALGLSDAEIAALVGA